MRNKKSSLLDQKLKNYSALAIGMTSLAGISSAQIFYTDEFPDEVQADTGTYGLNLNNSVYADFSIMQGIATNVDVVFFNAFTSNEVLGTFSYSYFLPFVLNKGDSISENKTDWSSHQGHAMTMNYQGPNGAYGYWVGMQDKYIGLRLKIDQGYQYGWARLDVAADAKSFVVKDYALQTEPNKGLVAGEGPDGMAVMELEVNDEKDNGNGSDIRVSFKKAADETKILEYRIMVVKLMNSFDFTPNDAFALNGTKYISVTKTGNDIDMFLPNDARDVDDDLITNKNFYRVYILSFPLSGTNKDAVLSTSSKSVVNVNVWAPKVTDLSVADVSNHGDGRDLQVSFTRAADESGIARYKVFVVPSDEVAGFDLYSAQNLGPNLHTKVEKTGSDITTILDADSRDINGDSITTGKEYVVFVMSASDGTNTTEDNLSSPSSPITLSGTSGIIEENADLDIVSFNNELMIRSNDLREYNLAIFDLSGKIVESDRIRPNETYRLDHLQKGIFIVKINDELNERTLKIVIN